MRLEDVTASLRETINEVTARMGEKNWPQLNFGSSVYGCGSGMTAWKAVLDQDWRFGVTGAALSLAPAVYSAFRGSDAVGLRRAPRIRCPCGKTSPVAWRVNRVGRSVEFARRWTTIQEISRNAES